MKIEIAKIVQRLDLSAYAPEYGDKALMVWVNPSRRILDERMEQARRGQALRAELDELRKNIDKNPIDATRERARVILVELGQIGTASLVWMAEILSQGPEETHVSTEDLTAFVAECDDLDPKFYPWISTRIWEMIGDYRTAKKKA